MSAATANLPALSPNLSPEGNLSRYLSEIRKFPLLEPQEEFMLAKRWREHGDSQAAHRLVTSHLRLVAKIAMGYRGYGLPLAELISEGNVGMMQAVKRFDPDRGFRLATYAMWWIRASIQEYILHSWSLVKMGTTAAQKKLFFNLRKLKGQMQAIEEGDLSPEQVKKIATRLGVPEEEVVNMNRRLTAPDHSLNASVRADGTPDPNATSTFGPYVDQRMIPQLKEAIEKKLITSVRDLSRVITKSRMRDEEQHFAHQALGYRGRTLRQALQLLPIRDFQPRVGRMGR